MNEELNLDSPFKVYYNSNTFIYSFCTDKGVEYAILFADVPQFDKTTTANVIQKPYDMVIEKLNGGSKTIWDSGVRQTIDSILIHFFENAENSIVFSCDVADGMGGARFKKFHRWYESSSFNHNVIKIDECISTKDKEYHSSLIYHIDNPFQNDLKIAYYEVVESMKKPT